MAVGVAIAIFGIIAAVNGVIFGLLGIPFGIALAWQSWKNVRDEHKPSSSSSSSSSSEPKRYTHIKPPSDDESSLKTPDDNVGYMIASEIERRLPAVTPSTGLYCDVYGSGTAYLRGGITLWHADDANRLRDAIQEGFNKALEKAYKEGYDVSRISDLDTSGVTIDAADLH
ncbi:MAG: hypothetical protein K5762_04985 [Bacilli bacterium]|nr:hypothetical protein [Bacilli bacterium]